MTRLSFSCWQGVARAAGPHGRRCLLVLASLLVCSLGLSARGADEVKKSGEVRPADEVKKTDEAKAANEVKKAGEAKGADESGVVGVIVDPTQVALDHLRTMTGPLQQAWLQRLEGRASRAARLSFDADEAKQQQAKLNGHPHEKRSPWPVLRTLIDETNRQEKEIINRLVRQYGNLVFDSFHKQIDVYDQRRQAWVDVYTDWKRAETVRSAGPPDRLA